MQWFTNLVNAIKGVQYDIADIKRKVNTPGGAEHTTDAELKAYINDVEKRVNSMVNTLKNIYSKYDIKFSGFKSLGSSCEAMRNSLDDTKDQAYNTLLKLESDVTTEQKRHLGLIRMAVTKDGKMVINLINQDPESKKQFSKVFGQYTTDGKAHTNGEYQKLWGEIHKLSEYIITQKNKVYH